MPGDSYYWTPTEQETDDSYVEKETYIDPWDLENYAYIREHLDSMELSSSHSGPSASSGEFAEPTSSFDYVPGKRNKPAVAPVMTNIREEKFDSIFSDHENYAAIEDLQQYGRKNKRAKSEIYGTSKRRFAYDYETEGEEVSPYAEGIAQENVFGIYDDKGTFRRVALPLAYKARDRSLSYSFGDPGFDYTQYNSTVDLQSSTKELPREQHDQTLPIYNDTERQNRNKPHFGYSKYGHLKIDYSCSWNNLNRFMKYN